MLISITGPECGGKDTAAAYLAAKGYSSFSLSDNIHDECDARGIDNDTPTLVRIANELRERFRPDILARRALVKVQPSKNYVANSIRNPAEAAYLCEHGNFLLVLVTTDLHIRYARHLACAGRSKYLTFDSFLAAEEEQKSSNPAHQQSHLIFSMADRTIHNNDALAELHAALDKLP